MEVGSVYWDNRGFEPVMCIEIIPRPRTTPLYIVRTLQGVEKALHPGEEVYYKFHKKVEAA